MRKYFHIATGQSGMVAWVYNQNNLLFTNDDFHRLVKEEMADVLDERKITLFITSITLHWNSNNEKEHEKLQHILHQRFMDRLSSDNLPIPYKMNEQDTQKYIDDFLEGYKANYGYISYGIGALHNSSDEILNISLRTKPNLFQKATGRLGNAIDEINIHRSELICVQGNATGFIVTLSSGKKIEFNRNGVHREI